MRAFKSFFKRFSPQAWSEHDIVDGKITNLAYNPAFVANLRVSLQEELIGSYRTDQEVVELWKARRDYEAEPPTLDVQHSSIDENGKLNLKLNWNDAFIRMLKNHGFEGETEDIIIQSYLASIARDNADGVPMPVEEDGGTTISKALDSMDEETRREFEREIRSRAARRRGKHAKS